MWVLLAGVALAGGGDPRGWSKGTVAVGAPTVLGVGAEPAKIELPPSVAARVSRATLLFYVAPTCPHCIHVAAELASLAGRVSDKVDVIGVMAGGSDPADVEHFVQSHGWTFPVVTDTDRSIASAMGARSTPSVLLVVPRGKTLRAEQSWYPYVPGSDVLVELRLLKDPWSVLAAGEYVGVRTCGACHIQEAASWALTHHAVAWRTLERQEKTDDPACVGCHVTGHGQPSGWDGSPDSRLVDVGCEACHGPSGPHDGVRQEPRETCEGCHDAEHTIGFRYEKGLPLIDHFRAADMTGRELAAARKALVGGEVPRALLAFDRGTYVGSQACESCHAAEHESWAASPHAQAMHSLTKQGAHTQVDCVKCHAVQLEVGPPPDGLQGYRATEGVGCEGCHGPGADHVAAGGGTENIVGLGKSCPVCVVEAVCTSCHTQTWDPTWDLKRSLERSRHAAMPKGTDATSP